MGQAKHVGITPANHSHSCKRANGAVTNRRAALASIFALSTAAGATAIVAGDVLLPRPAVANPIHPDADILAHVAATLPAVERLEALVAEENRRGAAGLSDEYRALYDATLAEAEILKDMRPRTMKGFVAKARIARYHMFLGIQIARDLDAIGMEGV